MKVLVLNGSPRRSGRTATLLKEIMAELPQKVDAQLLSISGARIQPCVGCLRCRPDKICVLPEDDAHRFGTMISEADFIVIGTPVYWGNIPGPLKTLFDRNIPTFTRKEGWRGYPKLSGKKAILVLSSTAPFPVNRFGSQAGGASRALKTMLRAGGVKVRRVAFVRDRGINSHDKGTLRKLRRINAIIARA